MVYIFDAANTLIKKDGLFETIASVLHTGGYNIAIEELLCKHTLLTESVVFPDRTNRDFYLKFNGMFLQLFDIEDSEIAENIYLKSKTLQWKAFDDTVALKELAGPKYILSNFRKELKSVIDSMFPGLFADIIISENEGVAKPDVAFYKTIVSKYNLDPSQVTYVGDSVRLDMIPAESIGFNAILIDRNNLFPDYKKRISTLAQLIR